MAAIVNVVFGGNTNFTEIVPSSDAQIEGINEEWITFSKPLNQGAATTYFELNNQISPYPIPYYVTQTIGQIYNQASDATV